MSEENPTIESMENLASDKPFPMDDIANMLLANRRNDDPKAETLFTQNADKIVTQLLGMVKSRDIAWDELMREINHKYGQNANPRGSEEIGYLKACSHFANYMGRSGGAL